MSMQGEDESVMEPEEDATVVVQRSPTAQAPQPRTDRSGTAQDDDATLVVERVAQRPDDEQASDDSTIVVRPGTDLATEQPRTRREARERRAERMRIELPDGQDLSVRVLAAEAAPEVPTVYPPRAVPEPPSDTVHVTDDALPSRADAPLMPSVRRSTVRFSAVATAAVVAACIVSVIGLVFVCRYVFGG